MKRLICRLRGHVLSGNPSYPARVSTPEGFIWFDYCKRHNGLVEVHRDTP